MFKVRTSAEARVELKKLKKRYESVIKQAFEDLRDNPKIGKPLRRELSNRYSYRIGVYRIIYSIDFKSKIVNIFSVKHRSIVYQ